MKVHLTAALMLAFAAAASAQAPVAALRVANSTDRARQSEPVSVGFPLPEPLRATDANLLALASADGRAVPCQFKVLSRWRAPRESETAPLKWVLATFETDAAPKSVAAFRIMYGAAPPKSDAGCVVTVEADAIRVRTSPTIAFSVPKKTFAPLRSAALGDPAVELVPAEGSVLMTYHDGSPRREVVTRETAVEEAGPVRVVLVQKGELAELRYTCRWTFHAGRADVALDFRLENPRAYGVFDKAVDDGQVYFASLELAQPIAGSTGSYELAQTWIAGGTGDMLSRFSFTETENGAKVRSGRRHSGAIDCAGPNGGATVAVAGFWQNYPKAIRKAGEGIVIDLFPAFGNGPEFRGQYAGGAPQDKNPVDPMALQHYRFEGGRWKTHRVVYDFHAGPRDAAAVDAIAANIEAPLVGCPEPSTVRKSFALGPLWVERGLLPSEPGLDRFERFLDIMVDDGAADPTGRLGRIGLPNFLDRGGAPGFRQPYGWENFGDIPWGEGFCNLHYDWPASILSGFLRTGDPRLFFRGRDMAVFRRDYGQNHSQDKREGWRGAAFYEKGWWHGNFMPGTASHNWVNGLALHYAITGDEWTRDAIVENCGFILRHPPGMWTGWWGSRIPGWQIECLVDAWGVIGDPKYLEHAAYGIGRFEELETLEGAEGYHLGPQSKGCRVWMENIFFAAAAKYVMASGDTRPLNLLARMKNWFKRAAIVPPQGSPTSMYLPYVYEDWWPTKVAGPGFHHAWSMTDCLSTSAYLFDDADDRMWAELLFETAVRYWQDRPGKARSPLSAAAWSPITMRPLMFPNSESKVLANILRYGASHLGMRAHAAGLY